MYDEKWVTRDGRHISVYAMETRHLINCINLIKRSRNWRRRWLPRLEAELENRRRSNSL